MTKYIQCTLTKKHYNSILQQVSYIPEKFAKLNEVVSLKTDYNYWTHDWKVISVGSYTIEVDYNPTIMWEMFI